MKSISPSPEHPRICLSLTPLKAYLKKTELNLKDLGFLDPCLGEKVAVRGDLVYAVGELLQSFTIVMSCRGYASRLVLFTSFHEAPNAQIADTYRHH